MTIDSNLVAHDVLKGFAAANREYADVSGGWQLHFAPEYFATVKIGESISSATGVYVTFEQHRRPALSSKYGQQATRWSGHRGEKRFDIAVWGPREEGIKGIIEVKLGQWLTYVNMRGDVRRVCDMVANAAHIEWGMSVFYSAYWREVDKPGRERLLYRFRNIERRARKDAEQWGLGCRVLCSEPIGIDDFNGLRDGVAAAGVLTFYRQS